MWKYSNDLTVAKILQLHTWTKAAGTKHMYFSNNNVFFKIIYFDLSISNPPFETIEPMRTVPN